MSKIVQLKHPLLIHKPIDVLSCPQKCKIPQNIDFPATCLAIVKSENRKFLCRLYYLTEVHDDKKIAYVDDAVELSPTRNHSRSGEIKWVQELELVTERFVDFQSIKVRLHLNIDELNLAVIHSTQDLAKLTHSIVKHYKFSSDCDIACNRNGISRICVIETDTAGYGTISKNGLIDVTTVSVESQSSLRRTALGGMKAAQNALESLIKLNVGFMENPGMFVIKPPCQALIIGPVGSGKTSLIHHASERFNCVAFEITSDVFKPLPGETEEAIQETFNKVKAVSRIVRKKQVILLVIENLEIFCPKSHAKMKENSHSSRISSLMFSLLDETTRGEIPIVVAATTSKLESLNDGVRRSSRMGSCEIMLDMPDESQRLDILKILCNQIATIEFSENLLTSVAQITPGFVGADLELLCQSASRQLHSECLEFNESNLQHVIEQLLKTISPSAMRDNLGTVTRSSLTLKDIGGMEELKKSLVTAVLGPLRHAEKFRRLGLQSPSGILLYGPSGCAKTTIVKCLAGESKMTLISVSSAEIYSPYVGEAEKFIVKLFNQARMNAPTILFFDEIDTIVGNRSVSGVSNDAHMRILSTLLTEIDGFSGGDKKTVLIVGATNKPHMIDDALMRPGRFDKLIHVPAPDMLSRVSILNHVSKSMPFSPIVDTTSIAEQTNNFSGADLINLCNEAAMSAATRDLLSDLITLEDFNDALAYLGPSLSENQIQFYANFEKSHRRKA